MRTALVALSLALATPALADTPERAALLVDAIRDNGCAMTGNEADAVLPGLGLDVYEVEVAVAVLFPAQLLDLTDDGEALLLAPALCEASPEHALELIVDAFENAPVLEPWSPEISPEQGAALIGALRDNDCALREDEAGDVLPMLGLDMALTRDAVTVLLEAGEVDLSEDGGTLLLEEGLCAADPAGDAALFAQLLDDFNALPPMTPDVDPLEVLQDQLGLDGVRAITALYAEVEDCTIALDDRAATETALAGFISAQLNLLFNFAPDWPDDAQAELLRLVSAALDDPGPEFSRDGDILSLTNCTP
ncbi:MAG: hypothetical protein JJU15_07785 [Pararhodobacter sp.]|nr:hypothetical protein [Pararhodobacter sp.]